MQRNIWIAYILTFLRNSWFWMGIWVFYYLHFTNYAGIGLIETVMIIAVTGGEVPTGAIADLFGKKKTLALSFFLQALGMTLVSFPKNVVWIIIGIFIAGVGGAFYSGTLDALVFDSLKEIREESKFDKVISKITSISLIAPAVCGIIGGFLYVIHPNMPFILNTLLYLFAIPLAFLLTEPYVKEKNVVSYKTFFNQMRQGFHQLFKNTIVTEQTILLTIIGAISVICLQVLNDFLGVEFGFKPTQFAIVWSFLYIICALSSYVTPLLARYISYKTIVIVLGLVISVSLIVSPFIGVGSLLLAGITIGIRAIAQTVNQNASLVLINEKTESEYRTTTLSTFSLLKNIPYALSAYFLGFFADKITSVRLASILGIILLTFIVLQAIFYGRKRVGLISNTA